MTTIEQLQQAIFAQQLLLKHSPPDFDAIGAWAMEASRAARLLYLESKIAPQASQSAACAQMDASWELELAASQLRQATTPEQAIAPLVERVEGLKD